MVLKLIATAVVVLLGGSTGPSHTTMIVNPDQTQGDHRAIGPTIP
jgi:hypothetical protein